MGQGLWGAVPITGLYSYRFDCAAASDSMFGGCPKSWGSSQPSVPARAICQSGRASALIILEELGEAATSSHNGSFYSVLRQFLEKETAARYRDVSLDAELDLSHISYIATPNDVKNLPGPLRDRFRLVQVPAPTLAHLPALAKQVMAELARDQGIEVEMLPDLQPDELDVVGRAWSKAGFSMRKLQKISRQRSRPATPSRCDINSSRVRQKWMTINAPWRASKGCARFLRPTWPESSHRQMN